MDAFDAWERLEAKRRVRPTMTGRSASAALAAIMSAADDAKADGAHATARALKRAAQAIQAVA